MQVIGYMNRSRQGGTGISLINLIQILGYAGKILDWFHFSRSMEATLADYLVN